MAAQLHRLLLPLLFCVAVQSIHHQHHRNSSSDGPTTAKVCHADMDRIRSIAKSHAAGRPCLGHCYMAVANYIDEAGFGGIRKKGMQGDFNDQIPPQYWRYARHFADFVNQGDNAAKLGLENLQLSNPYDAPPGSIIVVRPGTPGTANLVAGDIVVKGEGTALWNDGAMSYHGKAGFPVGAHACGGHRCVMGVYVPTRCSDGTEAARAAKARTLPPDAAGRPNSEPSPKSELHRNPPNTEVTKKGCLDCIKGKGGLACVALCFRCGVACKTCVSGHGGKACAPKCCVNRVESWDAPIRGVNTTPRCGHSWGDANGRCGPTCPSRVDSACTPGQHCYANLAQLPGCGATKMRTTPPLPVAKPSVAPPTPQQPLPLARLSAPPVSAGGGCGASLKSMLIAHEGSEACVYGDTTKHKTVRDNRVVVG